MQGRTGKWQHDSKLKLYRKHVFLFSHSRLLITRAHTHTHKPAHACTQAQTRYKGTDLPGWMNTHSHINASHLLIPKGWFEKGVFCYWVMPAVQGTFDWTSKVRITKCFPKKSIVKIYMNVSIKRLSFIISILKDFCPQCQEPCLKKIS